MFGITSVNFSGHERGNFMTVGKCVNNNDDKMLLCQNQSFLTGKGPLSLVFPLKITFFRKEDIVGTETEHFNWQKPILTFHKTLKFKLRQ